MSSEDIKLVEQTLTNLLVPDNNIRKSAEAKLNELQGNKPMLIFCLTHVLMGKYSLIRLIKQSS